MLRNIVSISCPWWPLGWRIADGVYTLELIQALQIEYND